VVCGCKRETNREADKIQEGTGKELHMNWKTIRAGKEQKQENGSGEVRADLEKHKETTKEVQAIERHGGKARQQPHRQGRKAQEVRVKTVLKEEWRRQTVKKF
jgi:hypothetical protein